MKLHNIVGKSKFYIISLFIIITMATPAISYGREQAFDVVDTIEIIKDSITEIDEIEGVILKRPKFQLNITGKVSKIYPLKELASFLDREGYSSEIFLTDIYNENNRKFTAQLSLTKLNDESELKIKLYGRYEEATQVPVLTRRMYKGDVIRQSNLKWSEVSVKKLKRDVAMDYQSLEGKALTRMILAGKPISRRNVENPILVEKNSNVSIFYKTKFMELKTIAIAMDNGSVGDIIRVKNKKNGTIIQALVKANGSLTVNFQDNIIANNRKNKNNSG